MGLLGEELPEGAFGGVEEGEVLAGEVVADLVGRLVVFVSVGEVALFDEGGELFGEIF